MKRKFYIAYGSNMSTDQMGYRCPDAELISTGKLVDWRLMFKGEMPRSFATVEKEKGFYVPCLIWDISEKDEYRLDRYEGYPRVYGKQDIVVEFPDGKRIVGLVYAKPEKELLNPPCDHYFSVLWQAYEKFGFDLKILTEALKFSDRLRFGEF